MLVTPYRRATALFIACLISIVLTVPAVAQKDVASGSLTWKNGDKLPGHAVLATDSHLTWQSKLFRDSLDIDFTFLKEINFNSSKKWSDTSETFSMQTVNGLSLYGDITKLDEKTLSINSTRFGEVEVDRARVSTILNLKNSGSVINGEFDLNDWGAKRNEKKYWEVNDQGELVSKKQDIHLYLKSELPESALIELEIEWKKKLDFSFALGLPANSRKLDSVPRLESWDDSIVLIFNNDFELVIESVDSEAKRLKIMLHWNRKTNKIQVYDERGKTLATADIGKTPKGVSPGIYLENKSGDLKVNSLMIRQSEASFDATKPSVQTKKDAALNGRVVSFDGTNWILELVDKEGEKKEVEVPKDEFCATFLMNPPAKRAVAQTRLKFQDGMYVLGDLVGIKDGFVSLKADFSDDPIKMKLGGASSLKFDTKKSGVAQKFTHRLFNSAGEIHGQLEPGSGTADDILRWRVTGAKSAVPFSQAGNSKDGSPASARILLQSRKPVVSSDSKWPDTMYLNNRDTVPCKVTTVDEKHVSVDSFFENSKVEHALIKAIDFRTKGVVDQVTADDDNWVIPKSSKKRLKIDGNKMSASKNAEFAHPWLLSRSGFEFDLKWKNNLYGSLRVQTMVNDVTKSDSGKMVNIMMYGQNMYVAANGQRNPGNRMINTRNKTVRIEFRVRQGKLRVNVNGKKAYEEKIGSGFGLGRGVKFKLVDTYSQGIKCDLSNFKLTSATLGHGALVDSERKKLLLTIPRLKRKNPPKEILCATNMDMVRGELVSLNDKWVMFRSNNEVKRFPRSIVTSLVWMHAEDAIKAAIAEEAGDEAAPEPEDKKKEKPAIAEVSTDASAGQTVQVLMHGGRRMTMTLDAWKNQALSGQSKALGVCKIPFDEIYELRFGTFATKATDIPYSDWVATVAPAPKLQQGGGGAGGNSELLFGSSSPMIGTTPDSFSVSMVDGSKYSLKAQKGKVVIIDFWATWCGPCVQAMPKIEEALKDFPKDKVSLIAMNQAEGADQIKAFMKARKMDMPVGMDGGKVGRQFQVDAIPQTVVIDQNGVIAFVKVGGSKDIGTKLKAAVEHLLEGNTAKKKKTAPNDGEDPRSLNN